jgi:hypothetical protein
MREPAPTPLSGLLQRLGLATPAELQVLAPTVSRLAGDLPQFQSVWIDALRGACRLTHYQAAEILAGRGESLRIGRYVLYHIVQECGYSTIYKARHDESHVTVRLTVASAEKPDACHLQTDLVRLVQLANRLPQISGLITSADEAGGRLWAASPWIEGTPVSEWTLHNGRFPPEVVLDVARAMLGELSAMESVGLIHGDIRIENVSLLRDGGVCLPQPGLRAIIRPHEGVAHCDASPEACGALAPERVACGTRPTLASDLFACGCVWWQMLCGRPPLRGGDTLARLRAAQTASIDDFRRWVSDVPEPLSQAISSCLQKDPRKRLTSFASLAQQIGSPGRAGRQAIARCLGAAARPHAPWLRTTRARAKRKRPHLWTAAALFALALIAVAWPIWVAANRPRAVGAASESVQYSPDRSGNPADVSYRRASGNLAQSGRPETAVIQAGYSEPINRGNLLLLPAGHATRADSLRLSPGIVVRAQSGRARVAVPPGGLAVLPDRVTFENIDFVPDDTVAASDDIMSSPTLVRIAAAECAFVGCSFQSAAAGHLRSGSSELSTAIRWTHRASGDMSTMLSSGRIRLENCVFRRVAAGIESSCRGAIVLQIVNTLHLGPGPMVRLMHCPAADEPTRIALSQITLREASSLVEISDHAGESEGAKDAPAGEINIDASACVFALPDNAAVLLLASERPLPRLFQGVKWSGRSSVVSPRVAFARWQRGNRDSEIINDANLAISGLVRGRIDFAGPCDGNPSSCRIVQCFAPLEDSDSPGANPSGLPTEVLADEPNRR